MGRDWFLHDIRNRFTVALGFTQLLLSGRAKDNPELQREYLGFVETALKDGVEMLKAREKGEMTENKYQAELIKKIKKMFPGCEILKNDSGYKQGIPDLTIIWESCWAMLDPKVSATAKKQPNQDYYIKKFSKMFFASFIYPENEKEVLAALQEAFTSRRSTRVPKS